MDSDENLVAELREGNEAAFNRIVERYKREMYALAYRFTGNHQDADDIAQETFLKAYRSVRSFRGDSSLRTWLYRIAVNTSINHLKKGKKSVWVELDTQRQAPAVGPKGEQKLLEKEFQARLEQAIARLPQKQKKTLILKVFQELKFSEIAAVMKCSIGTAKANFFHAVSKLKTDLIGYLQNEL